MGFIFQFLGTKYMYKLLMGMGFRDLITL